MYNVKIYQEVLIDIQKAADWYNDQLSGLGARFQKQIVNLPSFILAKIQKSGINVRVGRLLLYKYSPS